MKISDHKRAVLLENLEKILDYLDEIFLFIAPDTKILYANATYSRFMGIPRDKVVGRFLRDVEPHSRMIDVLESGRPVFQDYSYVESVDMEVVGNAFPVYNGDEMIGVMAIFRPISVYSTPISPAPLREAEGDKQDPFAQLIGESRKLRNVIRIARKVAQTDTTVLLRGETGVGKELFARAIHQASPFSDGPFVALNMASIPESLLESELFGYEPGAFTGAKSEGKAGLIESAQGGTLFLDEMGEISPMLQTKLLRVLQERTVTRVGGTRTRNVRFRLITATNRDLERLVEHGQFRPDLYYRINVIPIHLPPLQERGKDIILLAERFKEALEVKRKERKAFSRRVLEIFQTYSWPGNVRELESCVEYMMTLSEGRLMDVQHLPPAIGSATAVEREDGEGMEADFPSTLNLQEAVEHVERKWIRRALAQAQSRSEAIRLLGISRKAFYSKLKKYGLS